MKAQNYIRLFFFVLFIAVASVVTLYQNARRTSSTFNEVNHTYKVIGALSSLNTSVFVLESGVRGYVITGNRTFIKDFDVTADSLQQQVAILQQLTADNPVQQQHMELLQRLASRKVHFQQNVLTAYRHSQQDALQLIASLQGKALSDSLRNLLGYMERHEQQLLQQRISANRETTRHRFTVTAIIIAVAFGVVSFALFKTMRANRLRFLAEQRAKENEARYRGMVENSAVVMYRAGLDGTVDYISHKCSQLTGYRTSEFKGQPITFLVDDAWKESVSAFYKDQIQNKIYETLYAFPIRTKGGETKWIEQSMVLLLQDDGTPLGFQSVVKDITEKKGAEEALKEAEEEIRAKNEEYQYRLQAILDNIPMIVYIKDLEGRYIVINKRFRETFALTDEQVLGKENHEVFADADMAGLLEAVDMQVRNSLQPIEFEDLIATSEGDRHMLVTKFPLFDKDNNIFAVCGVDKDISDMVSNRQQLIDARLRAERAERLQEEFLANMSHEIRTPMNGIIGMTNLLEESALSEDQKEFVQLIKYSSNTLLALINDILDLSKIKAGRMTVEEIPFSVSNVVEEVASTFRMKAAAQNVAIVTKVDGSLPQHIQGDLHKLVQVLNNLVGNAVKFTAQGRISITVNTLRNDDQGIQLGFRIADTGMGIAPESKDYIFESFAQTGNDTMRRFGGTGLGLAITKRLIELQGGTIGVESRPGEGSEFFFEITYRHAAVSLQAPNAQTENVADKRMLAGKKILLVEDNLINQKVTQMLLQKVGLVVTIAGNGKEAVDRLEGGETFDLIIMDLQMPEMNGLQATAYIRNKLKLNVPIIAMTASALRNERERCFEMGMNEYLTKPFVPAELFRQLCRFLDCGKAMHFEPVAKEEAQSHHDLYNLAYLHELEDDVYLAETLTLFMETTPGQLEELRHLVLHEQWDEVQARAHKLKSSFGMLQMHGMLQLAASIESGAKSRQQLQKLLPLVTELEHQYDLVRPMLEADRAKVQVTG